MSSKGAGKTSNEQATGQARQTISSKAAGKTCNEQIKGQAGHAMSRQKHKRGRKETDHVGRDNKQIRDGLLQLQANEEGDGGEGGQQNNDGKAFRSFHGAALLSLRAQNIKYALFWSLALY